MSRGVLRLAIFDIDGTLRRVRDPWVHLHKHLGVAEKARGFLGRWQRGEISYEAWAQLDASLWCGYSRDTIVAALDGNPLRQGAKELVGWFTSHWIPCVGISSGLSLFNEITACELGMGEVISNELHFDGDICNGQVSVRVTEDNKGEIMDEVLERYSVSADQVVAFGDGTADIPMFKKAGLSFAIYPGNDQVRDCVSHIVGAEPIDSLIELVEVHFRVSGDA